ncbi:MAG: ribosome biogenesis GTPase YlqF [Lachnospiraceae bacterium]|jgi:ribosome biogenesis GTP-binding protein YlqF|nr:ribosome biogenesis GTPase YlqF [Lachnospiraceae bacterium]
MEFQWYPGHMAKAKKAMQEDIKLIDVIIELVDSRIPYSSKNPDIDSLANGKSRVMVMNKYDLADSSVTDEWVKYYEDKGYFVARTNSKDRTGVKAINNIIQKACHEKIERDRRRGILNRPVRALVAGIPNVGKSTFINSFTGRACTKTGNKPGVTKGKQWIRLNKNVELLDTPGILWPKFEDQDSGMRLAFIGSIKDELYNIYELSILLIKFLLEDYPGAISSCYKTEIPAGSSEADVLGIIAKCRGCIKSGAEPDLDKAGKCLVDDFRAGRLGRITLEKPIQL